MAVSLNSYIFGIFTVGVKDISFVAMSSETPNPQFNIVDLSRHGDVESCIGPFKSLRLRSLQLNPESFTSTYEEEAQFTVDVWEGRLKNPLASQIVAIPADASAQPDWVGMIVLLGPVANELETRTPPRKSITSESLDEQDTVDCDGVARYNINALFTMPSVRRLGLGETLVRSAINLAKDKEGKRRAGAVRVGIMADSRNLPAKCLYEKCGFVVIGESDISHFGTRGSIPDQPANQRCRTGLMMEQYILLP
ncbi:hypothetical protein FGG08_006715 [Glutinoglossum americanum]|uniref:N-acetyltransferase domain-containing protein n=1 Tax=Glutinoglossum americanum TaxID=1670608 RepID=A0A9P8HVG6_9PEZI|nr:hypothetical protein FGG08_006715 [Glutinoglossum americanum]